MISDVDSALRTFVENKVIPIETRLFFHEQREQAKRDVPCVSSFVRAGLWQLDSDPPISRPADPITQPPPPPRPFPFRRRHRSGSRLMQGAVLRVPAPIPPPLLPAPTRPLLVLRRCRSDCLPPGTPMASAGSRDGGGANKPDAAPSLAPMPQPPEKPLPGDCCGSGCVRCVWDIYFDELDAYDKALAAHAAASGSGGKDSSADTKPSDGAKP